MKKVEVVAGIIIYKESILCCQRKTNKYPYLSEKWKFPGGKLEEGETRTKVLIIWKQRAINRKFVHHIMS